MNPPLILAVPIDIALVSRRETRLTSIRASYDATPTTPSNDTTTIGTTHGFTSMKYQFQSLLVGALAFLPHVVQAAPLFEPEDAWARKKLQMPSGQKPLGDMLQAYSKASTANVFVDVTGVPLNTPIDSPADFVAPRTSVFPGSRGLGMARIAFQAQMSTDRTEPQTYILWPRPNTDTLAELIVAEQQKFEAATPAGDRAAVVTALKNFYVQEKGWKPDAQTATEKNLRAQGVPGVIDFSEFPSDLQGPLLAEFVFRVRTVGDDYAPVAWTEEYWKNARVHLRLSGRNLFMHPNPHDPATVQIELPPIPGVTQLPFIVGDARQIKVKWQSQQNPLWLVEHKPRHRRAICALPEEVVLPTEPTAAVETKPGFTFDPSQEAALQKTVAFAHQGVTPQVVVGDLSRQSGVALQLSPDVAPSTKVSAFSDGMTLQSAMAALARLHSARWSKDGNSFVLRSNHLDELHLLMARMGNGAFYRFIQRRIEDYQEPGSELADEIVGVCDEDELKSKDGIVFSSLPSDLQKKVLAFFREQIVGQLIVSQQRIDDGLSSGLKLRFAPLSAKAPQLFGAFYTGGGMIEEIPGAFLGAYTNDGRFIVSMFPELYAPKATAIDERIEKQLAEAEAFAARKAKEQAEQNP